MVRPSEQHSEPLSVLVLALMSAASARTLVPQSELALGRLSEASAPS